MKPLEQVKNDLKDLEWVSYQKVVSKFLSAFDLPETTITRLISKIGDVSCGPFFVYRKVVFYCCSEASDYLFENQCHAYSKFPLIMSFSPEGIMWRKNDNAVRFSDYEHFFLYVDDFLLLNINEHGKKDLYKTQDFGTLVASLYNSLRLEGNSEANSITALFNVIYISLFPIPSFKSEINNLLNGHSIDCSLKMQYLWILYQDHKNVENVEITVSNDSFSYIKALINSDVRSIDVEVLTSLVYKILDKNGASLYGHQTSFINVQKLINPLILNPIEDRLRSSDIELKKQIAEEILQIECLDPTNSPGSFLSAAYLGLLEIIESIDKEIGSNYSKRLDIGKFNSFVDNNIAAKLTRLTLTYCALSNIENYSITILNEIYNKISIKIGQPLYSDWNCYSNSSNKFFIFGSPRFLGPQKLKREKKLKDAVQYVFGNSTGMVDFSSAWLVKAAQTIHNNEKVKAAFVLTNSIVQGVQVSEIWPPIYKLGCEIGFAYDSFKWKTNDNSNVGVSVIIVGIQSRQNNTKKLYKGDELIECSSIGPYLLPGIEIVVKESESNLFGILPFIRKGNMPYDAGSLMLNAVGEMKSLIESDKRSAKYIKRIVGSDEFINSIRRWCVWIPTPIIPEEVQGIPSIMSRIEKVKKFREKSSATKKCIENPHKFRECYSTSKGKHSLVIPSVSSEKRPYIPVGFINDQIIVSNLAFSVYDCEPWVLAIVSSKMHMLWMKTVCGSLETRYRYSNTLGYNTFPVPYISEENEIALSKLVFALIEVRERYCERSLGELYNEMPEDLVKIHKLIDNAVDSLYRPTPFEDDTERLTLLINMYQNRRNHE